jgi:uncharacterized protein (TIGR02147 family)
MKVFEFTDYRDFIIFTQKNRPKKGYGLLTQIAKAIGASPSIVTQVLQKERDFTLEQADLFCEFFGFSELESEYFLTSVSHERSGTPKLKARFAKKLSELGEKAQNLRDRIPPSAELDEKAKATFYSQWYYSAIRLSTSIDKLNSPTAISKKLQLPVATVQRTLQFLLQNGLCVETNDGLKMGIQSTHLGAESQLVSRHHANWRLKGLEKMNQISKDELFFTSPVSISLADIEHVRKILVRTIEDVFKTVDPSPSEELACLSIDWFKL